VSDAIPSQNPTNDLNRLVIEISAVSSNNHTVRERVNYLRQTYLQIQIHIAGELIFMVVKLTCPEDSHHSFLEQYPTNSE
jgi:hypothetical protein